MGGGGGEEGGGTRGKSRTFSFGISDPAAGNFERLPLRSLVLGVDSLSILFSHRSFPQPDPFPQVVFLWFSRKIRIRGFRMEMEVTPRLVRSTHLYRLPLLRKLQLHLAKKTRHRMRPRPRRFARGRKPQALTGDAPSPKICSSPEGPKCGSRGFLNDRFLKSANMRYLDPLERVAATRQTPIPKGKHRYAPPKFKIGGGGGNLQSSRLRDQGPRLGLRKPDFSPGLLGSIYLNK